MKPLAFPFLKSGFTHECLQRQGRVLLVCRHKNGRSKNLEVVVTRECPERTTEIRGKQITWAHREEYPKDEDWGTYGFTFKADQLDKAKAKFNLLSSKYG